MKWRIEFARKAQATKPGQTGRRVAVELPARNEAEAVAAAKDQLRREGRDRVFDVFSVRKV